MAYCVPLGIPHSRFLKWDPLDQDKALAYMRAKAEICTCGSRAAEWERDRNAYVAEAVRCLGCELIEQERENVAEMEKDGQFSSKGVSIRLRRPQVDEEA